MQTMMKSVLFLVVLMFAAQSGAATAKSKWVSLDADSRNRLMKIVRSEVESRDGYSTLEEDRLNTQMVAAEKQKETSAYKASINAANSEFVRTKKRRDDLSGDVQTVALAYMWQESGAKTHSSEAYRGIPVQPGQSITVELTFRGISPNITTVPEFNFYPFIATRGFLGVYSWNSGYVPFKNIRIR